MGHEFIPLVNREDAAEFLKDHKGRRILGFDQVVRGMPEQVDDGRF
jgi:nitrous oxide reductase accessory protein NosL